MVRNTQQSVPWECQSGPFRADSYFAYEAYTAHVHHVVPLDEELYGKIGIAVLGTEVKSSPV